MEKIVAARLSYLAQTTGLLHNTQMGGRKQRSAIDTTLLLLHYIQQQKKGRITSTLFMDVKGAFDHVSKPKLLQILHDLQLPKGLQGWVASFLTNRRIQLFFDGQTQPVTPIETGILQGSPVSPILFLIYV